MSILLTPSVINQASGLEFEPEYKAVLNFATAQGYTLPSPENQASQNAKLIELKDCGFWDRLKQFYYCRTDAGVSFTTIDWKNPSVSTLGTYIGDSRGINAMLVSPERGLHVPSYAGSGRWVRLHGSWTAGDWDSQYLNSCVGSTVGGLPDYNDFYSSTSIAGSGYGSEWRNCFYPRAGSARRVDAYSPTGSKPIFITGGYNYLKISSLIVDMMSNVVRFFWNNPSALKATYSVSEGHTGNVASNQIVSPLCEHGLHALWASDSIYDIQSEVTPILNNL